MEQPNYNLKDSGVHMNVLGHQGAVSHFQFLQLGPISIKSVVGNRTSRAWLRFSGLLPRLECISALLPVVGDQ